MACKCGKKGQNVCDVKAVQSNTLVEAKNWSKCSGYAVVPVILGELTVQIDVEADITLCKPAIEIKRIKKNVFLTQCRVIGGTNKLFLAGYIRKNIEYATVTSQKGDAVCGTIEHTTVNVPFQAVTCVDFEKRPKLRCDSDYETIGYGTCEPHCGCNFLEGRDMSQVDMIHKEIYNRPINCELICSEIFEADIQCGVPLPTCKYPEVVFNHITEKTVLYLTVRLTQEQEICHDGEREEEEEEHNSFRYE